MFNMSGTEIVVILLLALVVLGPEKLPDAIRKFGKTYAELKKMGTGFQQEFKSAIDEPMREMRETADLLRKSADFTTSSAAPKVRTETTAAPVTDDVSDRPTRNDDVAQADPDIVPTDEVPFAGDDSGTPDVASDVDDVVPIEDVAAGGDDDAVPAPDDSVDAVPVPDDPEDESADRDEAADA